MLRAIDGSTTAETAWALTYRVPGPCPATALRLSPRQLLEQSPDNYGFITGLEIDGIDRDLVEVSALVRALLDVDVRVTGGEGELHGPARGPRPRRFEVEDRMRQHTVHRVLLDHGPDARHLAQLGHDARADLAIALHLRLLVLGQEQLEGGDEADDLLLGGLRGPADGLVGARIEGRRTDQVAPAREDPGALRPANPLATAHDHQVGAVAEIAEEILTGRDHRGDIDEHRHAARVGDPPHLLEG